MKKVIPGGILDCLTRYLKKRGKDLEEFLSEHASKAQFESNFEFKKSLNKSLDPQPGENKRSPNYKRIYYNWLIFFRTVCNIPVTEFTISRKDKIGQYLLDNPDLGLSSSETYSASNFQRHDDTRIKDQIKDSYATGLSQFIHRIKTDIFISDYIERYLNIAETKSYVEHHKQLYDKLETIFFNQKKHNAGIKTGMTYVRVLCLPLRGYSTNRVRAQEQALLRKGRYSQDHIQDEINNEIKKHILRLISVPLFKHILNVISYEPSFQKNYKLNLDGTEENYSGIYMGKIAPRGHSYAIINDRQEFLTEYYKYSPSGKIMIDRLLIESGQSKGQKESVDVYQKEIINSTKGTPTVKGLPKFTLDNVADLILELQKEKKEVIQDLNDSEISLKDLIREEDLFDKTKKELEVLNQKVKILFDYKMITKEQKDIALSELVMS